MNNESKHLSKIEAVGRQPLNVMVYENLKNVIINGDLPAGSKITETEVAKQMNVSATPVREAFRRLSAEGLVKIIPWRGVVVQSFSENEIFESYQCREALEVLAIRLAVENIDEEGIKKLHKFLAQAEKAQTASELVEVNSEIHNLIIDYSHNNKLKSLLALFSDVIYHDRNLSAYNFQRRAQIHLEHVEIVDALEKGDVERAEEAMRTHINNGLGYILKRRKIKDSKENDAKKKFDR